MIISEAKPEDLERLSNKVTLERSEDYNLCVTAYALKLNNRYKESLNIYKKALLINNENKDALMGIADCYKKLKQYDLAIKYLMKVKHLTPFDRTVHYELGITEYDRQNYLKAIGCLITAIKLSPEYYDAIYALGQTHEAIEEYEMAEMIYLKIIENRPSYILAYNRLANMYIELEDYPKAIRYFREILSINPDFHRAYLGIAISYDKSFKFLEAKRYYKKYLELKPYSSEKQHIMERLEKLRSRKTFDEKELTKFKIVR